MTPREARWFLHFQPASASPPDHPPLHHADRQSSLSGFTQDRKAGIGAGTPPWPTATIPQCGRGRASRSPSLHQRPPPAGAETCGAANTAVLDIMDQPLPEGQDRIGAFCGAIE